MLFLPLSLSPSVILGVQKWQPAIFWNCTVAVSIATSAPDGPCQKYIPEIITVQCVDEQGNLVDIKGFYWEKKMSKLTPAETFPFQKETLRSCLTLTVTIINSLSNFSWIWIRNFHISNEKFVEHQL